MTSLTKRQREVLDFIQGYIDQYDYGPSLHEIKDHLGVSSVATVHKHIKALKDRGRVGSLSGRARSIFVIPETPDA